MSEVSNNLALDTQALDNSVQERLNKANEYKQQGSQEFKSGEVKKAGKMYIRALKELIPIVYAPDAHASDISQLACQLRSNLAMCQLKLKQYERTVCNCNYALCGEDYIENGSEYEYSGVIVSNSELKVKCLYRRASAYMEQGMLTEAQDDINQALALESSNSAVLQAQKELNAKLKQLDRKDAIFMKKYFES